MEMRIAIEDKYIYNFQVINSLNCSSSFLEIKSKIFISSGNPVTNREIPLIKQKDPIKEVEIILIIFLKKHPKVIKIPMLTTKKIIFIIIPDI